MTPIFNTKQEYSMMHICCKFGDSISNPLKVIMRTSQIFKNSKSKWSKWPWRSKSMTSIFNISQEYPMMPVWCKFSTVIPAQICDELLCGQGKVYGQIDGQTDGQTQETTMPLRPERPRGNKTKDSVWNYHQNVCPKLTILEEDQEHF